MLFSFSVIYGSSVIQHAAATVRYFHAGPIAVVLFFLMIGGFCRLARVCLLRVAEFAVRKFAAVFAHFSFHLLSPPSPEHDAIFAHQRHVFRCTDGIANACRHIKPKNKLAAHICVFVPDDP